MYEGILFVFKISEVACLEYVRHDVVDRAVEEYLDGVKDTESKREVLLSNKILIDNDTYENLKYELIGEGSELETQRELNEQCIKSEMSNEEIDALVDAMLGE